LVVLWDGRGRSCWRHKRPAEGRAQAQPAHLRPCLRQPPALGAPGRLAWATNSRSAARPGPLVQAFSSVEQHTSISSCGGRPEGAERSRGARPPARPPGRGLAALSGGGLQPHAAAAQDGKAPRGRTCVTYSAASRKAAQLNQAISPLPLLSSAHAAIGPQQARYTKALETRPWRVAMTMDGMEKLRGRRRLGGREAEWVTGQGGRCGLLRGRTRRRAPSMRSGRPASAAEKPRTATGGRVGGAARPRRQSEERVLQGSGLDERVGLTEANGSASQRKRQARRMRACRSPPMPQ
jgi:hypothetical protein